MNNDKKARYMARFKTFSPRQKKTHVVIALRFLLQVLKAEQAGRKPKVLDG